MTFTPSLQRAFDTWVDGALTRKIPKQTVAFHFNLYESIGEFHVQLIGAEEFSRDDPGWPCAETFSTGEDIFAVPHAVVGAQWEACLEAAEAAVRRYMETGSKAAVLRASRGVGVGFVDGDVEVVWAADVA